MLLLGVMIGVGATMSGCGALSFNPKTKPDLVAFGPEGAASGRTEMALELDGNIPVVEVMVNGAGPFRFAIDTGSFVCILDNNAARSLALDVEMRYGSVESAAGEQFRSLPQARIDWLSIGGARFSKFDALVIDLRALAGANTDGVLGIAFLHMCRWTIDYPRRRLVLESFDAPPPARGSEHQLRFSDDSPVTPAALDGVAIAPVLDTGSDLGFALEAGFADRFRFLSPPSDGVTITTATGDVRVLKARVDGTLQIGTRRVVHPPVSVKTAPRGFESALGGEFLRHFAVTFDVSRKKLWLDRDESTPLPLRY